MREILPLTALVLATVLAGCTAPSLKRNAVPRDLVQDAQIVGLSGVRHWANQTEPFGVVSLGDSGLRSKYPGIYGVPHSYLAISGGGANGAFTAGIMSGWSKAGTRPEFTMVTGVSTGALIAPFAFLGSDFDHVITQIYTQYSTSDIVKERGFLKTIFSDAGADSTPLAEKIAEYVTHEILEQIALESSRGRYLSIVTTNLDVGRPVAWDIGAIANSDHPDSLSIVQQIILASASIPVAFPPVMFDVEAGGEIYDEMHVDGGATSVVHLYPMNLDMRRFVEALEVPSRPDVYVIRNGQLNTRYKAVSRSTIDVLSQTLMSLMDNVVYGDLYRIYLAAQRDDLNFYMATIPSSFVFEPSEPFDPELMRTLYELGYEMASGGYPWATHPPGFQPNYEN